MKNLISRARSKFQTATRDRGTQQLQQEQEQEASQQTQQLLSAKANAPLSLNPPSSSDILSYRLHHGTNLGSIFVLEKWLFPSLFPSAASSSELSYLTTSISTLGLETTSSKLLSHWSSPLATSDWTFLANTARCTTIRLPLGYFTLLPHLPSSVPHNTPFSDPTTLSVYRPAWSCVQRLISTAHDHQIGVLLDLHALPGGANADDHSGTNSGRAELWENTANLALATACVEFLATEARSMPGVVGVQLCNEAVHGAGALGMYDWYESVVAAVGRINVELHVYISDAWDLTSALRWSNSVNTPGRIAAPVVVDTHRYYCFAEQDKRMTPREAIEKVNGELGETGEYTGNVFDGKCAGVVVGEWSCVLDGATWGRVDAGERDGLVQEFGRAQGRRWREMCGGACFWTAKMEWMDGGEWGFVAQTKTQALLPPEGRSLPTDEVKRRLGAAEETREKLERTALDAHAEYWETQSPGLFARRTAEAGWDTVHEGYVTGWRLGWADARAFLEGVDTGGGDRIGLLDLWVLKRMRESRRWKESDEKGWEWEQGFRKGVHDFEETTGLQRA